MNGMQGISILREWSYLTPYSKSPLLPLLLLSLASQRHAPKTKTTFKKEYDYIVVGAGSAGSVVASRLSELPCVNVLLLEAGKSPPLLTEIPGLSRNFLFTDIDWKYKTVPQKHCAACHVNREVPWPSGKTLGGSSVLNAMLYVRGNRRNYDSWAENGATGWSYEDVLPYFRKLEDNRDPSYVANGYHGVGGPVTFETPTFNPPVKFAEIDAILNMGYEIVDPNGPQQNGFYDYQLNIRNGQRCSTAKAYLVPAENRTNLDILANAFVRKVLIKNKKAVGVEFDFHGATHKVRARREVILSAGCTNSAQLLMLSGIGPMPVLEKFGIPLVADLPVGRNFQDQCCAFFFYELDNSQTSFEQMLKKKKNVLRYINNRTGPLTSSEGFNLMSFLSNEGVFAEDDIVDHSLYFIDYITQVPIFQIGLKLDTLVKYLGPSAFKKRITCASQILHPRSRGTISLKSANPYDPPEIDPNYLEDFQDVEDVVRGLKRCDKIFNHPAMKKVGAKRPPGIPPQCKKYFHDKDLYFRCLARCFTFTTNHQVGTAKMGDPNDPTTVVDPQLRVKQIKNLRVIDASIMPTITWGNTNIPTIMIAEKASDMIKKTFKCYESKLVSTDEDYYD